MEELITKLEHQLETQTFDTEFLRNTGEKIINDLKTYEFIDDFDILFNLYFNNLLKYDVALCSEFKTKVYSLINDNIKQNKLVTPSMLIASTQFEIYQSNLEKYAKRITMTNADDIANYSKKKSRINYSKTQLKYLYEEISEEGINDLNLWLLYIGCHELGHAFVEKNNDSKDDCYKDSITELSYLKSDRLITTSFKNFYMPNHDIIPIEYWSDMWGHLKTLEMIENFLPDAPKDKVIKLNEELAKSIVDGNRKPNAEGNDWYSARRKFYDLYAENKPNNFGSSMHMPSLDFEIGRLDKLYSENLLKEETDDLKKIMLGEYTPYLDYVLLVSEGKITTTNLFRNLEIIHQQKCQIISGKEEEPINQR